VALGGALSVQSGVDGLVILVQVVHPLVDLVLKLLKLHIQHGDAVFEKAEDLCGLSVLLRLFFLNSFDLTLRVLQRTGPPEPQRLELLLLFDLLFLFEPDALSLLDYFTLSLHMTMSMPV